MKGVTQGQLSLETTAKPQSGHLAGNQSPLSASSAPDIVAAKDSTYGERSVSMVEDQKLEAWLIIIGCQKSGNMRRPTSRLDPKMRLSA